MAINYSAELKPGGKFPLIDSNVIRGGFWQVETTLELEGIMPSFKKIGMLCYNLETSNLYLWDGQNWNIANLGSSNSVGIPILTKSMVDLLGTAVPKDYIIIPDSDDLNGTISNNLIETSINGNYVDVLFKSLRFLQSEVNRLKNAFKYGIQSYTGLKTAISSEVPNAVDDEPLWAIDEESLSNIPEASININSQCELLPKNNLDLSYSGKVIVKGTAYWEDLNKILHNIKDSKLITYITTDSLQLEIVLRNILSNALQSLNLSKFNLPKYTLYNITLILNRKDNNNNKNYLWLSINNGVDTLLEGYFNNYILHPTYLELPDIYTIYKYKFNNLVLFKCNTYTKYEDFSNEVIPSVPEDDTYKYKVAHITIRAVDDYNLLESIINQLPDNELIWANLEQQLYIKTAKGAVAIGSAQKPNNDGMTEEQIIKKLENMGIIYTDGKGLLLSNISDVTFVNLETNKLFKFEVDAYGKLKGSEIPKITLADKVSTSAFTDYDIRGFVGLLGRLDYQTDNNSQLRRDLPFETHADRIKIGAFYPPLKDATVFGCSHAYIELENTSGKDFPLDGCYLHYAYGDNAAEGGEADITAIHHLALRGVLKAGSTYLIRGKKYAEFDDKNVKIKVKEFDLEWYVDGLLIDLTRHLRNGLALTYGLPLLTMDTPLWKSSKTIIDGSSDSSHTYLSLLKILDSGEEVINSYYPNIAKCPQVYETYFIDSLYYINTLGKGNPWAVGKGMVMPESKNKDCIFKNTFQLDPAMQAFQSLNKFDSSRVRWQSANDYQCVYLDKDYIEFPKTSGNMKVSQYTPKASYENKNVSTDKTKMDLNKPNVVFCSMGIDIYKTRTFNWISAGYEDEYVWLRKKDTLEWHRFESYKKGEITTPSDTYPKRKEYSDETKAIVYNRFSGRFPGDGTYFTSHKCVIEVTNLDVLDPTIYEYVVGLAKVNSTDFDPNHSSKIKTFTLYPKSYTPRIYQHSDELGFDWIQYLVWGAAAIDLNKKINEDLAAEHIIPILIDTGDVVQNGTRINEWLDYYSGGECLFDHLEAMDVVGNNDLCDTDPSILGTGDDDGKSNSFYFHIFHCLDINENPLVCPIINKTFIPSLYYLDTDLYRILMLNSELTYINCKDWFKLSNSDDTVSNIYTGYKIGTNNYDSTRFRTKENMISSDLDVPIYTKLYLLTDPKHELGTTKKIMCACHEMPFTVITNSSLLIVDMAKKQEPNNNNRMTGLEQYTRSINELNLLIGSHMNQIDPRDTGKGIYWFSRLMEYRGIKLCIGGHKHTYACSYPVRENYSYLGEDGLTKKSYTDGPMKMDITLEEDSANWLLENYEMQWMSRGSETLDQTTQFNINTTKIPLVLHISENIIENTQIKAVNDKGGVDYYGVVMLPRYNVPSLSGGVIYFMCQATGYKYASNKELPSQYLAFSQLKPHTTLPVKDKFKDTASADLMRPMFSIITLSTNITIKLVRVEHIFLRNSKGKYIFNLVSYDKEPMSRMYLNKTDDEYGVWSSDESTLITINY